jgi:hypothetical protein
MSRARLEAWRQLAPRQIADTLKNKSGTAVVLQCYPKREELVVSLIMCRLVLWGLLVWDETTTTTTAAK